MSVCYWPKRQLVQTYVEERLLARRFQRVVEKFLNLHSLFRLLLLVRYSLGPSREEGSTGIGRTTRLRQPRLQCSDRLGFVRLSREQEYAIA